MARSKKEIVNSFKRLKNKRFFPSQKSYCIRSKRNAEQRYFIAEKDIESERLYQKPYFYFSINPSKTIELASKNLINLIDYRYCDVGENDIENMYNAIDQGDINSSEIQKLKENIKVQYKCLCNAFLILYETGQLKELLSLENKNIEFLNELLSADNQIEKLNRDGFKTMIDNIDLEKKEDVIKLLVFNRQLLNRLGHNYEESICIKISKHCKSSKEYNNEMNKFIAEVYRIDKPNDNIKNALELEIRKLYEPKDFSLYNHDQKEDNYHYNYVVNVYSTMIGFFKQYNKIMESDKKNNINPPKFYDFINKVLRNDNINDIYSLFTRVIKERNAKGKERYVKENLIDKIRNYVKIVERNGYMNNPVETLIEISKDLEIEEKIMKVKHIITMMLVRQYELGSNQLYIENDRAQNGKNGVVDVYLDGYLQVFGGHYKSDELEATDQRVQSLNSVRSDVNLGFEKNSRGMDLSVGVPMQKLTEGQVREFRELTRTIDFLEGRMGTEEVDKSTLPKLELLEGYKEKDPSLYNILKVRILLGAGLDKFKEFYGIDDKQRFSVKNMLSVEQIVFAEQMVGIIRNNMMTLETLKNSVDPMVFDFISLELQRGNDVKSVLNSSMVEHISNEGQNREGALLTRKLRGDIQQEQAD